MKKRVLLSFGVVLLLAISVGVWMTREDQPFYLSVEAPPAPALTPAQAMETLVIAPGFEIDLVAAEPMVVDPVAMDWDEAGRLFVVEMRGFMPNTEGDGEDQAVGRVVMLKDDDGDGVYDRSTTFLDGLVLPRAVAVVNEGLLVAEPPVLWLCPDIQGKQRCDEKVKLADYATNHERVSMEHLENGLLLGLDNWIYNAKSDRRFRLQGDDIRIEKTLARGQWGIAEDNQGRLFYNTNSNFLSGDLFRAHSLQGSSRGLGKQISTGDEVFSVRVNPGVNRAYLDGVLREDGRLKSPTAVSGLAVYRGGQFPEDYWGDIFVPEPAANAVVQLRVEPDQFELNAEHITYPDDDWGQREFLASTDERFRPVDMKVGPDGALYVIDMYRGIIQHKDFLTDELKAQILERGLDKPLGQGRIWRIRHKASPQRAAPNLVDASSEQLIAALADPVSKNRSTAQRLLIERDDVNSALREQVRTGESLAAVHALWVLEARGGLSRDLLVDAVKREDVNLAIQSLRAGAGLWQWNDLAAVRQNFSETQAGHDGVYLAYARALLALNDQAAVQQFIVSALQAHSDSVYRREALTRAAAGVELAVIAGLRAQRDLQASEALSAVFSGLASGAYHSARNEVGLAESALRGWIDQFSSPSSDKRWVESALMHGFGDSAKEYDEPIKLSDAPAIFVDKSLSADDPLWQLRLDARRGFTWPGDELASGRTPLTGEQTAWMEKGQDFYKYCANCHGPEGQGVPGLAPELAGSEWVTGPVEWLARIILDGMHGEIEVNGKVWNGVMPGHRQFAELDAQTLTGLMIHLRRLGVNRADAPELETVQAIMAEPPRSEPWTAEAIREVPYATGFERFTGKYKVSFVTFTVSVEDGQLFVAAPMYGSTALDQVDDVTFGAVGADDMSFRFNVLADGSVDALYIVRGTDENRVEKVK